MLKRKAQGVSIGIIVIAAIALVVIVIIIGLLTGKLGSFGGGIDLLGDPTKPCHEQGTPRDKCEEGETQILSSDAAGKGKKCCKDVKTCSEFDGSLGLTSVSYCNGLGKVLDSVDSGDGLICCIYIPIKLRTNTG